MATVVKMPKQGMLMKEGTITKWLVNEGEQIENGEPLFEMETDKLTITIDSPAAGTILKIIHRESTVVPIAKPIAIIGDAGENIEELLKESGEMENEETAKLSPPADNQDTTLKEEAASESQFKTAEEEKEWGRCLISPRAKKRAEEEGIDYEGLQGSGPDGMIMEKDIMNAPQIKATPLARKIAAQKDMDLSDVLGTGAYGKIVREDVLAADRVAYEEEQDTILVPFTGMRKVVADRMKQSQMINAQTTHAVSVNMSRVKEIREALKQKSIKVSYNDIIAYCTVHALQEFPDLNAEFTEKGILQKKFVNLGVAVALEEGLIVPVIKNAHKMDLKCLGETARDLAERARTNRLQPDEYTGGTFTISNLGMMGIEDFVAIINPPESGILAIGAVIDTPVSINGQVVVQPVTRVTLSYDHRVVDGAPAARFLSRVKELLENPYLLL